MKLPIHMVCSCKFVRADVCVGRFVANLSVDLPTNSKLNSAFICGALKGIQMNTYMLHGILYRSEQKNT